jgi:hypothetical protein
MIIDVLQELVGNGSKRVRNMFKFKVWKIKLLSYLKHETNNSVEPGSVS